MQDDPAQAVRLERNRAAAMAAACEAEAEHYPEGSPERTQVRARFLAYRHIEMSAREWLAARANGSVAPVAPDPVPASH